MAESVARYGDADRICACFPGYAPGDDLIAEFVAAVKCAARDRVPGERRIADEPPPIHLVFRNAQ